MSVFGLDEPDTKPLLDSEIDTTPARDNESIAERVYHEAVAKIVYGFDMSSSGSGMPKNGQPVVRTNGKLRTKSVCQCLYMTTRGNAGTHRHIVADWPVVTHIGNEREVM